jgi:hypothetical protein
LDVYFREDENEKKIFSLTLGVLKNIRHGEREQLTQKLVEFCI